MKNGEIRVRDPMLLRLAIVVRSAKFNDGNRNGIARILHKTTLNCRILDTDRSLERSLARPVNPS